MNIKNKLPSVFEKYISEGGEIISTNEGDWKIEIKYPTSEIKEYFLNQEVLLIAKNEIGDFLFLTPDLVDRSRYNQIVYVFWHEEKRTEIFEKSIENLLISNLDCSDYSKKVFYFGGKTEVMLGDEVSARDLLIRKTGRVIYIPGKSKKIKDLEHDGLAWIGIRFPKGAICGAWIDPSNSWVKKSVKFIKRSSDQIKEIHPDERFV